jgi:hypothetical protein
LTSALSGYLPLTGGTLTGALSGTSASFSGVITSTITADGILSALTASTLRKFITIGNSGTTLNLGIENSAGGDLATGTSAYASVIASVGATRDLQLATNNTVRLSIASTGAATFSGNVASASFSSTGQISTGNGVDADILINVTAAGAATKYASIQSSVSGRNLVLNPTNGGNVGIGVSPASANRFVVKGEGTTGSFNAISLQDSGATDLFYIRCDGYINSGLKSVSPYNFSTSGRSMVVDSAGGVGYLVSTKESKSNIESIKSVDFINQLNPVQFNYRKKDNITNAFTDEVYDNITYGFIADEVEMVNKELVFYNEDGTLAGVEYNNMIAVLTKAIQEQQAQIEELKALISK